MVDAGNIDASQQFDEDGSDTKQIPRLELLVVSILSSTLRLEKKTRIPTTISERAPSLELRECAGIHLRVLVLCTAAGEIRPGGLRNVRAASRGLQFRGAVLEHLQVSQASLRYECCAKNRQMFQLSLDLTEKVDFHMFKKGIRPVWEDAANCKGGKWILRLKKGLASRIWENLLLAMIGKSSPFYTSIHYQRHCLGEQFLVGEEICGAVCSVRSTEDILSLWNRTADSPAVTNRIRDTLRRVLNLPTNAILEYKRHDDCLK